MFSIKIHILVFMLNLRCESLENIFSLIFVRIPNTYVLVMVQLFFHVERVVDSTTITGTRVPVPAFTVRHVLNVRPSMSGYLNHLAFVRDPKFDDNNETTERHQKRDIR